MGQRNFLVEGVSGTGKTSVCDALQRRGYHAVHGDRELAYQGDLTTGDEVESGTHANHLWHGEKVRALVADQTQAVTFFCGGCRNFVEFLDLFDGVLVLEVDLDTLMRRLEQRPADERPTRGARADQTTARIGGGHSGRQGHRRDRSARTRGRRRTR